MTSDHLAQLSSLAAGLHSTRLSMTDIQSRISDLFPESSYPEFHKVANSVKDARIDLEMFERVIQDKVNNELRKDGP